MALSEFITDPDEIVADLPFDTEWRSARRKLTEGEFALIHDLTWSIAPIHNDVETASDLGLDDRNMSGPLVVSVTFGLVGTSVFRSALEPIGVELGSLLGINNARFPSPLNPGNTVYAMTRLVSARPSTTRPGEGVLVIADRLFATPERLLCEVERACLFRRRRM